MKWFKISVVLLLLSTPAFARELPSFFEGVRPLGMGGAFTAVSDDENALFYNPAGLDKVPKWGMGIINPFAEVGEKGYDFYEDASDIDFDNLQEVTRLLQDYNGEYLHYRAGLFPHFVMQHFALGVLGQTTVNVEPGNPSFPEADVDALATVSGHLGVGFGFFDDILRVGAAAKYVKAYRLRQIYTADQIAAENFDDQVEDDVMDGAGFGFDAGAMVTLPVILDPTFAVSIQNIADTDLGDAGELPQQINVGASVGHAFSWLTLTGAADWVDVTQELSDDDDPYRRLHLGLEASLPKVLSVRGGFYQGYGSLGATLDLWILKVDYATYTEEIGSAAGDRADTRHVFQVSLGW